MLAEGKTHFQGVSGRPDLGMPRTELGPSRQVVRFQHALRQRMQSSLNLMTSVEYLRHQLVQAEN